jgi:KDO2-lipid IV(A) lauroyltransferase
VHAILGYLIADLVVRLLPAKATQALATALARLVFALRPRARRTLEDNLGRVSPRLSAAERRHIARQAFEHFALSIVEFSRLGRLPQDHLSRCVAVRGRRHLEAAGRGGRGVIVLSAHAGNWEWGAAWMASSGIRLHVVSRAHAHPWVERLFVRRRAERGVRTIPGRPVWASAAPLLRQGEWVALMGDRPAPGSRTAVCAWAAALARRTGAVVLPAVILRTGRDRYAVHFAAPLDPAACAGRGFPDKLQSMLRRAPAQWLAFEPLPAGWA